MKIKCSVERSVKSLLLEFETIVHNLRRLLVKIKTEAHGFFFENTEKLRETRFERTRIHTGKITQQGSRFYMT